MGVAKMAQRSVAPHTCRPLNGGLLCTGIGYNANMETGFKPGDAVVVLGGTFEGYTGTVERVDGGTAYVTLVIFGRVTPAIPIAAEDLRAKRPDDKDPLPGSR
jgi:hypothetical protein